MSRKVVVLPFFGHDPHRKKVFDALYSYYTAESFFDVVTLGDLEVDSRSSARNDLIRAATYSDDLIAIVDADVYVQTDVLEQAFHRVTQGASWCVGYDKWGYHRLKESFSDQILNNFIATGSQAMVRPSGMACIQGGGFNSYASALIMSRDFFERCGGYDERFRGWGYEDDAFRDVAITFGGEPWRPSRGFLTHFWHPEPNELTWDQPNIQWNEALHREYKKRKKDKRAMREFLEER